MASTLNCIICFEKSIPDCKGCYGEWKEEMGKDESFGQLMYIDKDGIHPADDNNKP